MKSNVFVWVSAMTSSLAEKDVRRVGLNQYDELFDGQHVPQCTESVFLWPSLLLFPRRMLRNESSQCNKILVRFLSHRYTNQP